MKPTFRSLLSLIAVGALASACSAPGDPAPPAGPAAPVEPMVRTIAEVPGGTGGLELGPDGAVYSSEFGDTLDQGPMGTRVFRVTPDGEVSLFAEGFDGASGNAFDAAGRFVQSNIRGNTISLVAPGGAITTLTADGLQNPVGVIQGADGDFYVANCGGNSVVHVTPDGTSSVFSDDPLLKCPNGIAQGSDGAFYVSNFYNGDVVRVAEDGADARLLVTVPGDNNGHLVFGNGVLYVAGRGAHQIFQVGLDGETEVVAGSGARGHADGPAGEATLSLPNDLALSADGRTLYFNEVGSLDPDTRILFPTLVRAIILPGAP
ncbi:MAG: hypothetical protein AB7H88_09440 [Vicinamibacterales bacterium]